MANPDASSWRASVVMPDQSDDAGRGTPAGIRSQATDAGIVVVTLDWPAKRNSIGPDEARQLRDVLADVGHRPSTRGLVLTGNGAFSAGGDLKALLDLTGDPRIDVGKVIYTHFQGMVRDLLESPVPTAAAVDGPAIGLGMDLALACDLRFVGPKGWMMQGWARLGLVAGTGGAHLTEAVAPGAMWSTLLENGRLTPAALHSMGLGRASDGPALDAATQALERLAAIGADALALYLDAGRRAKYYGLKAHQERCATTQAGLLRSEAFHTRVASLFAAE